MRFKHGTKRLGHMHPAMRQVIREADTIWQRHGRELVVTCPPETEDYQHSKHSWHWYGCAVDLRSRYFADTEAEQVAGELREALGCNYDVVVESTHIHVEYEWERARK